MSTVLIVAQVFAFFAFILYTLSFQFKKRKNVLKTQIFANIFYTLEYITLDAYAGVNNSIFGITRSILFYVFDQLKTLFFHRNYNNHPALHLYELILRSY